MLFSNSQLKLCVQRGYTIRDWAFITESLFLWTGAAKPYLEIQMRALKMSVSEDEWKGIIDILSKEYASKLEKCPASAVKIFRRMQSCGSEQESTNGKFSNERFL